ncbi:exodeoxyribonuclease V subunit gamma [Myxococcota bacterium]|nr:exodeoxyribonuclease V subunit gamma [Myxococcota bacterium]MBU1380320.1 exodeoxyribonuclease V subunit gamma [Myxococcota bacterium]MBU1495308.1 exodeoxyribonuclease V subunit gamma [Myxococcota bacterium]
MNLTNNVKIIITTEIHHLVDALSENISIKDKERDLTLDDHQIIVPNYSVTRWLKYEIARRQGIYHNIKFATMEPFFLSCISPDNKKKIWNTQDLKIQILHYLLQNKAIFESLGCGDFEEKNVFSVSSELALIINKKLKDYPDLKVDTPEDEPFYKPLTVVFNYLLNLRKKSGIYFSVHDYIAAGEEILLPDLLHIFAPGFINKNIYSDIDKISDTSEIIIYSNTLQLFEQQQNQFLSTYGRAYVLNSSNLIKYSEFDNAGNVTAVNPVYSNEDTLSVLKNCLVNDEVFSKPKSTFNDLPLFENIVSEIPDQTIHFISGPGLVRECETVKDLIITLMAEDENARLSDFCVNIADTSKKSRYFTVLNFFLLNAGIPVTTIDTVRESASGVLDLTEKLVKLTGSEFSYQAVKEIIFHESFCSLDSSHKKLLEKIIGNAGIYRGMTKQDLSDTYVKNDLLTWKQGLFRIICSCFLDPEDPGVFETSEGRYLGIKGLSESDSILSFIAQILDLLNKLEVVGKIGKQSIKDWAEIYSILLSESTFTPDISDSTLLKDIIHTILQVGQHSIEDLLVSGNIARELILTELSGFREKGGQYTGRGVTISSMGSLRPIPFRYRFVIGLNEKGFPPSETVSILDPEKGRLFNETSKSFGYFIEAILGTEKQLWLSYQNRELKKSSPLNPSRIMSELHGFLELQTGVKIDVLEIPLLRTDPKYLFFPGRFNKEAFFEVKTASEQDTDNIETTIHKYNGKKFHDINLKLLELFIIKPWEAWIKLYGGMTKSKPEEEVDYFEPVIGAGLYHNLLLVDLFAAMVTEDGSIAEIVERNTRNIDLNGQLPSGIFLDIYKKNLVKILENYKLAFTNTFPQETIKNITFPCLGRQRYYKSYYKIINEAKVNIDKYEITGYLGPVIEDKNTIIKLKRGKPGKPSELDIANIFIRGLLLTILTEQKSWNAVFLYSEGQTESFFINLPESPNLFLSNMVNSLTGQVFDYFIKIISLAGLKPDKMKESLHRMYATPERNDYNSYIYNHFILNLPENPEDLFKEITGFEKLEGILKKNDSI